MSSVAPSVVISGIGTYIPENRVTNDDISKIVETSDEWIRTRSGIGERRIAAAGETTSNMGAKAAQNAMADAGVTIDDIDLIVVGTMSPDMPFPSTACLIQAQLGIRAVPAFDIVSACSGFLYTLEVATQMVRSGNYRNALVIGAEKMSAILDWQDRSTCVLFGDGAGAVVLSPSQEPGVGVIKTLLRAQGAGAGLLHMPAGGVLCPASTESIEARGHFLKMNGKEIFKHAVREMGDITTRVLEEAGVSADQVKCIIPHQANIRIIESLASRLKLPMDRFLVNIDRYGNTSSASIPIALAEARATGRFGSGDYTLMAAFGAGLTWGGALIKWP